MLQQILFLPLVAVHGDGLSTSIDLVVIGTGTLPEGDTPVLVEDIPSLTGTAG